MDSKTAKCLYNAAYSAAREVLHEHFTRIPERPIAHSSVVLLTLASFETSEDKLLPEEIRIILAACQHLYDGAWSLDCDGYPIPF